MPTSEALVQREQKPLDSDFQRLTIRSSRARAEGSRCETLRHKKDFVGVGIFYFGAGRKSADIDVALIRRVRAGHKSRLIRNRDAIREIAFGRSRCRRSRGLWRRVLFRGLRWRRRLVWIVGLCYRLFWRTWITRHAMTHWRLIIRARDKNKASKKHEPR